MRRLVLLRMAMIAALASPLMIAPDCASACSCAGIAGTPRERVGYALSKSEAVFTGEVTAVSETASRPNTAAPEGSTVKVTFKVSEVWKGEARETVEVTTDADPGTSCGFPFEKGQEYLVYASEGMKASTCSETKPLSIAGQDLEVLGADEEPESGNAPFGSEGNGNLPDTGGVRADSPYPVPVESVGAAVLALAFAVVLSWRFLKRP